MSDPRTDAELIRDELDTDEDTLPDSIADRIARRAHILVEERVCGIDDIDEDLLEYLETLVGAHFAVARVTGSATGEQVTQVQQESASVTFTDAAGSDSSGRAFWEQAVMLDPSGCLGERRVAPAIVGVR